MDKIITAVVSLLTLLACGTPPAEEPDRAAVEERLQLTLGGETVTLGALHPIDDRPPFCAAGQLYETRSDAAALRVCVPLDGGPATGHVMFNPGGRRTTTGHWYSGLLEAEHVQVELSRDGTRRVRVQGRAVLPIRAGVASFLGTVEAQALSLSGTALILTPTGGGPAAPTEQT